jgi:hypothetical protein
LYTYNSNSTKSEGLFNLNSRFHAQPAFALDGLRRVKGRKDKNTGGKKQAIISVDIFKYSSFIFAFQAYFKNEPKKKSSQLPICLSRAD